MSKNVTELTGEGAFDGFIAKGLTFVDFWAPWCGPCKAVGPIVEEIAGEFAGKAAFAKVNVDEGQNQSVAMRYGIMSIPTMMLFKDGQAVDKIVGMRNKAFLTAAVSKHV